MGIGTKDSASSTKATCLQGTTFADVITSTIGPWNNTNRKNMKTHDSVTVTIQQKGPKGKPYRTVRNNQPQIKTTFIGQRWMPSTLLYLRNIFTDGKCDDDIMTDIKKHAKQTGIRVMFTEIVRNRYIDDVIGCKIRVPSSQVANALDIDIWPQDVICRK